MTNTGATEMNTTLETDDRFESLDRQNQRLKKWLAAMTAWMVLSWLFSGGCSRPPQSLSVKPAETPVVQPADKSPGRIVAKEISIVDDDGREIVKIGRLPDPMAPGFGMQISGNGGMIQVAIKDQGMAGLSAKIGDSFAGILAHPDAASMLMSHHGRRLSGVCNGEHSRVSVKEGKANVTLEASENRSVVQTADANGVTRAALGVVSLPDGWMMPDLHFFDGDFRPIVNLSDTYPKLLDTSKPTEK